VIHGHNVMSATWSSSSSDVQDCRQAGKQASFLHTAGALLSTVLVVDDLITCHFTQVTMAADPHLHIALLHGDFD
jgi:Co/Zn/Cd efflux system component